MDHRLQLISFWDIKPGSKVLELGCGQGESTIALADAVGEGGHVDAVDNCDPEYGEPFKVTDSTQFILNGPLGKRISFHLFSNSIDYLNDLEESFEPYDCIIMSHSIWFLDSPETLTKVVSACARRTKALCVAEWGLRATRPQSQPHLIAAVLQGILQANNAAPPMDNIRTVLSPTQIKSAIINSGKLNLQKEELALCNEGILNGYWEISNTFRNREKFLNNLREEKASEKEIVAFAAGFDAIQTIVENLEGTDIQQKMKTVLAMDVWIAKFVTI